MIEAADEISSALTGACPCPCPAECRSPPSAFPVLPHTPVFQAIMVSRPLIRPVPVPSPTAALGAPAPPVTPTIITHTNSAQHNKTPRQPTPGPPSSSRQLLSSPSTLLFDSLPPPRLFQTCSFRISNLSPLLSQLQVFFSTHRKPPLPIPVPPRMPSSRPPI